MDFLLLGPLEVLRTHLPVLVAAGKQRALLAILLLNANRTVSRDQLIDSLWGEDVPESAQKMVQIHVSQLRKALPEARLQTRAPGYVLEVGEDELDLTRFERLLAEGRDALSDGEAAKAARLLREALALWRGPALAEFSEPFARLESSRLEEQRLACLEERIEADLALAQHAELVGELDALVHRHPHRERFRAQLMLALYRSGRQAEALERYHAFRRLLADELGIDPSLRLKELERQILQQDSSLDVIDRPRASPARSAVDTKAAVTALPSAPPPGRAREFTHLARALEQAAEGERGLVFVTGDAGIGKTTIVESLIAGTASSTRVLVAHGQCVAQRGAGEPYLPVLDALGRLTRQPSGRQVVPLLARQAPAWLAQMPWLLTDDELAAVQRRLIGATSERMLREMVETLEAISEAIPIVLVLEDLHWSDLSTIDLLNALARRREPARLLVLGTYRRSDAVAQEHPVHRLVQELRARGLCSEVAVGPLSQEALHDYVTARAGADVPPEIARVLRERTGGNPLFATMLLESWLENGLVSRDEPDVARLARHVPDTVRELIEQMLDELDAPDRDLLTAASAAGQEFSSAEVAAATERSETDVDARCDALARAGRFIEQVGEERWPDGTLAVRYRYVHDLHREVLYDRLSPSWRALTHERIGMRLEAAFADRAVEIAGELAAHFLRGHRPERAVPFLHAAAQQALARSGHREAMSHVDLALGALERLLRSRERTEHELALRITLANALITSRGWAAPEVKQAYERARDLCAELGETRARLLPVLYGLCAHELIAGRLQATLEQGQTFLQLAEQQNDDAVVVAHRLVGLALLFLGRFESAREHFEEVVRRFDPERHKQLLRIYHEEPGIVGQSMLAVVLDILGQPGRAAATSAESVARARSLGHPFTLAFALYIDAARLQLAGEERAAGERAEETYALAAEHGIVLVEAWASAVRGWSQSAAGRAGEGATAIETALAAARATGSRVIDTFVLLFLADARRRAGDGDGALRALEEALAIIGETGERWVEAELLRLRGEVLVSAGKRADGAASLREALEIARRQGARAFELRATESLARLGVDHAAADGTPLPGREDALEAT